MKECSTCAGCFDDLAQFCPTDGNRLVDTLPGSRILDGRWQIERVIGVGRHGSIYEATDLAESRPAFVKTLLPTLFRDPSALQMFNYDVERLRGFSHPNAGSVYAGGKLANGGAYLAGEFVAGPLLRDVIAEDCMLTVARAVRIAIGLADALAAAHAKGLLHRDVKPGNILLATIGGVETPKLVDFESTRWAQMAGGSSVTATGSLVVRLPHYTSPEVCRGELPTASSDIYALGIVLYEMLTGRPPFNAQVPTAVIVMHVTDAPEPPTAVRPDVPKAVERAVLQALEKKPGDRFASAEAMATALRSALGGCRDEARPSVKDGIGSAAQAAATEAETLSHERARDTVGLLKLTMSIVDASDDSKASRRIDGVVRDMSENGMRIETGTVETGQLNVIRDHTTAFKNRLEIDVKLPDGPVHISGFAAWYKPAPDGINWNVGVYIREMSSADRARYQAYLAGLAARA